MFKHWKEEWFGNIRGDILAGLVVALALIPEAIAFSIIAGVDPMVGLYASFCIAVVTAFVGGRPGMISAATGAMALVLVRLVAEHGLQYMLAATILTGVIQIVLGLLKVGNILKFIPRPVMIGFVNALAILIFAAQLPHFQGESWMMYALVALGLFIIYVFPRITTAIPSPLVAIVVITTIAFVAKLDVRTVGDMGAISATLPSFLIPNVPLTFETLMIIFPYSLSLALVGLIESLLTAQIVDDLTDTESDKNKESRGQGIANIVAGFFGGMAGCAMIGQSVINVKSGGRGRFSSLVAGVFLMLLIVAFNRIVVTIPLAALVAVMIMVSISTFDWGSIQRLAKVPKADAFVMIITVAIVVITHNLAIGVIAGMMLSALFFAADMSKVKVTKTIKGDIATYDVEGTLFFASANDFVRAFHYNDDVKKVNINLAKARIKDETGVHAIDRVVIKMHQSGVEANVIGLSEACETLVNRLALYNKPGGLEQTIGH
ncbi:SulP family inorganic anion transporter [Anoxybacillus sp. D401a]|uniref:SulP family inorganic anion transporter n=1 Tax=Anoxybacillus sp. D401a TaxID=575112 RepID=UPI003D325F5E